MLLLLLLLILWPRLWVLLLLNGSVKYRQWLRWLFQILQWSSALALLLPPLALLLLLLPALLWLLLQLQRRRRWRRRLLLLLLLLLLLRQPWLRLRWLRGRLDFVCRRHLLHLDRSR